MNQKIPGEHFQPTPDGEQLSAFDRLLMEAIGQGIPMGLQDDPTAVSCPILWKWLSTVAVGEDKLKTPPYIKMTLGPAGVLAQVTDPDLCRSLEVSCAYLDGVFTAFERALQSPNPLIKKWGRKDATLRKRKRDF